MCGRYAIAVTAERIEEAFDALWELPQAGAASVALPRFNVAPTQPAPVVRAAPDGRRVLSVMRWGLVPAWAEDPSIGSRLINARIETAASKPSFRGAWKRRRCLVPITHFYEWKREGSRRQPMAIGAGDASSGRLLALAGLWERWHDELDSFTILTTAANDLLRPIHDRMPVIVPQERWTRWLDPKWSGPEGTEETIAWASPDSEAAIPLQAFPVALIVNSPRNDSPQCLAPLQG